MTTPILDYLKQDSDLTMHTHTEADLGAILDTLLPLRIFTTITNTTISMSCWRFAFWEVVILFWMKFVFKRIVRTSRVQFKILYAIISFVSVYMVNMLIPIKRSIEESFHNKSMLGLMFIRGISFFYISLCRMGNAAFPSRAFVSSYTFLESTSSKYMLSLIPRWLTFFKLSSNRRSLTFFECRLGYYSRLNSFVPRFESFSKWHIFNYNVTGDAIQ